MKYIPILFILFSCSMQITFNPDNDIKEIINQYQYITYKTDDKENWQYADETLKLKTGDCEDQVILIIDKVYKKYGYKCDLVITHNGKTGHALMHYDGAYYECQAIDGKIKSDYRLLYYVYFDTLDYNIKCNRK